MISDLIEASVGWLKGRWPVVVATAIVAYFGYHALHGERGFLAWIDKSRDLEAARQELARLAERRQRLERDVQAFQRDSIDRDLLEEELRKLGYVKPNEVIILRRDGEGAGGTSG